VNYPKAYYETGGFVYTEAPMHYAQPIPQPNITIQNIHHHNTPSHHTLHHHHISTTLPSHHNPITLHLHPITTKTLHTNPITNTHYPHPSNITMLTIPRSKTPMKTPSTTHQETNCSLTTDQHTGIGVQTEEMVRTGIHNSIDQ
jgi:hypothetical protein